MGLLTTIFAIWFYTATLTLIGGLAYKTYTYATTPAPLKIPTMPAPLNHTGVALRLGTEIGLFASLFRSNKWIWLFGTIFHLALLLVLLRHIRYFIDPVWTWVLLIQPLGKYAGFAMAVGLLGLLARRILVQRIRYITQPSDYLMLILLLIIGGSGLITTFAVHTDIVQFKAFTLGLLTFNWQPLPTDPPLLLHLAAVNILMMIFPFSKLIHSVGIFFSPTRNQADDSREKRHLAPWAKVQFESTHPSTPSPQTTN